MGSSSLAAASSGVHCNFQVDQTVTSTAITHLGVKKDIHENISSVTKSQKVPVNKMVRTDWRDPSGRLHAYLHDKPGSQNEKKPDKPGSQNEKKPDLASVRNTIRLRRNLKEALDLTSIQELVREIDSNVHPGLYDIVKNCIYVGLADENFALLQHNTLLYLVDVVNVSKELMYQQAIHRFGNFNAMQLSEPAPLQELLIMALKDEDLDSTGDEDEDFRKKIAEMNTDLLMKKAELLDEYFSIHIDEQQNLTRLPVVLDQHTPDMDHVPEFLLTLGNDIIWTNEKDCFQTIAAAIGDFYAMHPPVLPNPCGNGIQFYKNNKKDVGTNVANASTMSEDVSDTDMDVELVAEAERAWAQREWTIQHVLFPSMRLFLKPPNAMARNGTFVQVASLEKLYKIFERC